MARMHSRKKGKSGSTKPVDRTVPSWVTLKPKEVELLVVKFAKEGQSDSQIGIHLRDAYGIPSVKDLVGKSISAILKEKKIVKEIPDDLMALIKKAVLLRKHMIENHKDMSAKRGVQLTESKIRRLSSYYKETKVLPADWKYDPNKVKLYVN